VLQRVHGVPVRLSPIVASELLRGASGKAARLVERGASSLVPFEPASVARSIGWTFSCATKRGMGVVAFVSAA
jgi:hypothetical protein